MGSGRSELTPADINRALRLARLTYALLIAGLASALLLA